MLADSQPASPREPTARWRRTAAARAPGTGMAPILPRCAAAPGGGPLTAAPRGGEIGSRADAGSELKRGARSMKTRTIRQAALAVFFLSSSGTLPAATVVHGAV